MHEPPQMVDLFAGPGGLDVAARWLGVAAVGIEWDENACATRFANELDTRHGDVRDYDPSDFPTAGVLAGGPPCQTYTVAGGGTGRRALDEVLRFVDLMADGKDVRDDLVGAVDERTGLVLEPLRWALTALESERGPYESIVLEQVQAVLPVWKAFGDVLRERGYSVAHGVLRTEQFGVPQTRRRAVLIARLGDSESVEAELPSPTHRPYRKGVPRNVGDPQLRPWVTMGEALGKKEPFEVISNYGTGGDPKARGRRRSSEPAFTVTGKISRNLVVRNGIPSRFSLAESGRLQTFPQRYRWSGRDIAQQIGNAIPPVLGVHVLATALGLGAEERDAALSRAVAEGAAVIDPEWVARPARPDAADGLFAAHQADTPPL